MGEKKKKKRFNVEGWRRTENVRECLNFFSSADPNKHILPTDSLESLNLKQRQSNQLLTRNGLLVDFTGFFFFCVSFLFGAFFLGASLELFAACFFFFVPFDPADTDPLLLLLPSSSSFIDVTDEAALRATDFLPFLPFFPAAFFCLTKGKKKKSYFPHEKLEQPSFT